MKYKKLVYGNDLDSLAYSFLTGIPIVMSEIKYPMFFEYFKSEHDLSLLNIVNAKNTINTPKGEVVLNESKINVFKKLLLVQSILGKIKFHEAKYVRLEDNNVLNVLTQRLSYDLHFDKLYVINDNLLNGADHDVKFNKAKVFEKFHIAKRLSFYYDLISAEDFNLYTVQSKRAGVKTYSTMEYFVDRDKIDSLEYSLIYNKYKILNLFKQHNNDLTSYKDAINLVEKTVVDNNTLIYNESDNLKQVRFSLEDYLCQKQTVQWWDAYPSIVANKFTSMSTQIF